MSRGEKSLEVHALKKVSITMITLLKGIFRKSQREKKSAVEEASILSCAFLLPCSTHTDFSLLTFQKPYFKPPSPYIFYAPNHRKPCYISTVHYFIQTSVPFTYLLFCLFISSPGQLTAFLMILQ